MYTEAGFDNEQIHRLPGCAFWIDDDGLMMLGYTTDGATLEVNQNVEAEVADESGATPLHHVTTGTTARITLRGLQATKARLARVCPTAVLEGVNVRFGLVPGTVLAKGKITHRPFAYGDGSQDLVLSEATMIADLSLVHNHKEPMAMDLTFEGCLVEALESGNLIGGGVGQ